MKIKFFNSIRVRIILTVILLISIPFGILQVSNFVLVYQKLEDKTVYTTEALSMSIATNMQEFIYGAYYQSLLLSENENIINGTGTGKTMLERVVKQSPYFMLIYIQDMTGQQSIRSEGKLANRADRWWFRKIKEDPQGFVSEAYVSVNEHLLVTSIFLPLFQGEELTGVYGSDLTLKGIQETIGQYWDKDISYLIMDSKGTVLSSSDIQQGDYINYLERTKRTVVLDEQGNYQMDENGQILTQVETIELSETMDTIIKNALNFKTQSFQFQDNQDIIVCSYRPIHLPGNSEDWSVIVFQKQTDYASIFILSLSFVTLILLSIAIIFRQINRQLLLPVFKIQKDMEKIASGSLNVAIDIPKENELGALATNINKMVDSLKLHQQTLDEKERMAALGMLVAGVAHEINTPLGIGVTTSSYMQKINEEFRKSLVEGKLSKQDFINYLETMDESLDLLLYNLERGSNIIQSFKKMAVNQTSEKHEEFNLKNCIQDVVTSLFHEYKNSGHVIEIRCDDSFIIKSYPGAFAQILTNFIMNSLKHAFKQKTHGTMTIEAKTKDNQLILTYQDDGSGMNEELRQNIFTPFFTTSKDDGGSGLGMSIVYNLVTQKLNGKIEVESQVNQGTLFRITLPLEGENSHG